MVSKDEDSLSRRSAEADEALLSRVSYDLRTPLSGITAMVSLLLDTDLGPEQREMAEVISDSASALLAVLETTVEQAQVRSTDELNETEFDLRTMVEELSNFLALKAHDKGLSYSCLVQPDVPAFVRADSSRIRQILIELIGNAIKFTTSGEVVLNVVVENEEEDTVWVRFSVNDTGRGLSASEQASLSNPLLQKTQRESDGGGLYWARKFTADVGGQIGAVSDEGNGTTFFLVVPIVKLPITDTGAIRLAESLRGRRVLVADRSEAVRRLICAALSHWGCEPKAVTTSEQALDSMRSAVSAGTPYAVVIVDSEIGGVTAEELCVAVRMDDSLDETAMVLLAPLARQAQAARLKKVGFRGHLCKPVRQRLLYDTLVTTLHDRRAATRQARPSIATDYFLTQLANGPRVLVADDHMVSQKVALRLMTRLGCRVTVVGSGSEAVEALASASSEEPFELVLMDLQMPGMDGLETARRIRSTEKPGVMRLPIVAMTAHALDKDRYACLEAGMDDFLAKPIDVEQLGEIVTRWTARRRR
ncbi:MAG: response regulator [Myxococcota bacterium]|nr:response regulator [Myxococcota bacterium]